MELELKQTINLISDTVTKPCKNMLAAMMSAEVGDDVFKEDPTVMQLEEKMAKMFGHEAALFCPSGTMTNQIAIKVHTKPLDEVICEKHSHIFLYEVGGYAFHSGVAIQPVESIDGKLNSELIIENIKGKFDWLPNTKLVVVENTGNRTGGNCYTLNELNVIKDTCRNNALKLHLDGARIFNAIIEESYTPIQIGEIFDSISVCLSKGLGAPIGSVLISNSDFIKEARKVRKVFGGGMRQAGIIAAAGIYALDHNIPDLKRDHEHANLIKKSLLKNKAVSSIKKGNTNIIIFDLQETMSPQKFIELLMQKNIRATAFGKQSVRFVTHRDVSRDEIDYVCEVLESDVFN
ncbi:MAG: threonine aldolase [Saprospiraceae bacterium]|nr:threonine aldolase [Saprospiraceae bacterium]